MNPTKNPKNLFKMNLKRKILPVILMLFAFCFSEAAEIVRVSKSNLRLLPKGKEVDAMIGDWVLKNDKVLAVIANSAPEREANQMVSSIQGAVIDFTLLSSNNDQLTVYYPQGARVDVPSADTIIILKSSGNEIQLKAVKYATSKEPFIAETTYSLSDGESFLKVKTVYRNTSANEIKIPVYDVIRCDNLLEDVTPAGKSNLAFVNNKWYDTAYGVLSSERKVFSLAAQGPRNLITLGHRIYFEGVSDKPEEGVTVPIGQEFVLTRILVTGKSVADLQFQQVAAGFGKSLLETGVLVMDSNKKNLEGAFVDVRNEKGGMVSSGITDSYGNASILVPNGTYTIIIAKPGHNEISETLEVKSASQKRTFVLKPEARIRLVVKDGDGKFIPVKVEFTGVNGTKNPFFGPATRSNGVQNLFYSAKSDFSIPVPEGEYEIVLSHGPEYNIQVVKAVSVAGEEKKLNVVLTRAFSSPGYVIGDLHNHTTGSGDSNAGIKDRIINIVSSGVEFAPATEHNRISTYTNVIKELNLQKFLASATGIELSGRPGPGTINHQIAFPLALQPELRGYGAPKTDKNPFVQMKRLYDYDGGRPKLMQQNHPEISQLYFDKNADGIADGGFGTEVITDVMEIRESMLQLPGAVNGGNTRTRSFQWLQMLNLGYRIMGVANSDGHAVGHASGSIFNYILTKKDRPELIDSTEIAMQVKKGHVIMSNGPFMTVGINNALPGQDVAVKGGKFNVMVKILAADWCKVNTVQILVNGKAESELRFDKTKNPSFFTNSTEVFNRSIPVSLSGDAHIIVMAYGEKEDIGMVVGKKGTMPIALSNPIFVDVDGNGFVPNKDLLGKLLPLQPRSANNIPKEESEND